MICISSVLQLQLIFRIRVTRVRSWNSNKMYHEYTEVLMEMFARLRAGK